jgi:preprotein translocase subunit SecD
VTGFRVGRYLVALLTALIAGYLLTVALVEPRRITPGIDQLGGTRVRLTAQAGPDGASPSADAMAKAQQGVGSRLRGLGISGAQVVVDGDSLVVTAPGNHADDLRGIGTANRLYIRPVIQAVPAQSAGQPGPPQEAPPQGTPDPGKDLAQRIADEKKWRQSPQQGVQLLGLQFQATRCAGPDILAGNDDPALPLVTCSTDNKTSYLLAPSILGNDQIESATPGLNGLSHSVDLKFTADGTRTWADFTSSHIGSQIGFTLDSRVVSAPVIMEAIPGGRTQINGGAASFTAADALALANALSNQPLPVNFETSAPETVPPKPNSATAESRSGWLSPPTGVVVALVGVLVVLLGVEVYWFFRWIGFRRATFKPRG